MMHHPNMHHQAMSGHPAQHMPGHQGMPGHHQMPAHQMHRENRVAMGPASGGVGMAGMGCPRPPHAMRPHPPQHHLPRIPQQMKPMRRNYPGYAPPPAVVYPPPPPPPAAAPGPATEAPTPAAAAPAAGDAAPEPGPDAPCVANSKEKTPMCLVNELARYNKIKHQYRLTSETGPAHKKVFTVTLRLGESEEYTADGSSIKRAQHCAASAALTQTRYPAPPARAPPAATAAHHRHSGTVMPTVELNALAMKLCQPAIYTNIPPVAAPGRFPRTRPPAPYRMPPPLVYGPRVVTPCLLYRVRVAVGGQAWLGEGPTPQAARHDAAARALQDLRPDGALPTAATAADAANTSATENGAAADILNSEIKSPVSLVHELALKRNLTVIFTVKSERGPPHMRVFITACTVGDMETEGEGNGKKVSKRRAAEKMLDEMRRRWPPALLRARPPPPAKRKPQPPKKKPRNLIKESSTGTETGGGDASDNPISRLAMVRHMARARSPQYSVVEERGAARRREFVVQCDAAPHKATGHGPNKKTAKRRAAHNVLLAMELGTATEPASSATSNNGDASPGVDASPASPDAKRKESEATNGNGSSERQPVPGVLMMDYHQRTGQPPPPNGVSESSATGGGGGAAPGSGSPGAKDQLMYLAQLLGFTVQFSDFPKRNHGEYLSLVSLSTVPPVMCHGGGASTALSHEQCSRAALRALALMGLDAPAQYVPRSVSSSTSSAAAPPCAPSRSWASTRPPRCRVCRARARPSRACLATAWPSELPHRYLVTVAATYCRHIVAALCRRHCGATS
ncbi:double-stranded RNA-binding protein Staufen homolog 2 isoform X4 [Plutella xylostella]|uniref:double-stranded RNA-binding protein Staufen homolog 2 isoform X4 n=1 Tax=Plutella xylostella TaxID=51655 RepID=UPI00203304E7|nr:double-stranded RNA-binding protein Staufen homolog 2 isoform X4 [Plutella xylostella]